MADVRPQDSLPSVDRQRALMRTATSVVAVFALALASTSVQADSQPHVRALMEIRMFSLALEHYRDDVGSYPSQSIGLDALLAEASHDAAALGMFGL